MFIPCRPVTSPTVDNRLSQRLSRQRSASTASLCPRWRRPEWCAAVPAAEHLSGRCRQAPPRQQQRQCLRRAVQVVERGPHLPATSPARASACITAVRPVRGRTGRQCTRLSAPRWLGMADTYVKIVSLFEQPLLIVKGHYSGGKKTNHHITVVQHNTHMTTYIPSALIITGLKVTYKASQSCLPHSHEHGQAPETMCNPV